MFQSNSEFSIEARQIINTFKRTWRQNKINFTEQGLDLKSFNISRKHMRHYNDSELHETIQHMIRTLIAMTHDPEHALFAHRGISNFTEKLKNLCSAYTKQNNAIMHVGKNASSLLIHVLQYLSLLISSQVSEEKKQELQQSAVSHIKRIKSLNHQETTQKLYQSILAIKAEHKELYFQLASHL